MVTHHQEKKAVKDQYYGGSAQCRHKAQRADWVEFFQTAHRFHKERSDHRPDHADEDRAQWSARFTAGKDDSREQAYDGPESQPDQYQLDPVLGQERKSEWKNHAGTCSHKKCPGGCRGT